MRNFLMNGICKVLGVKRSRNNDVENNSSKVIEENEMQTTDQPTVEEVEAHGKLLSKKTYKSIKNNNSESAWEEIKKEDEIFEQKSPKGNTVLHIAALYKNDNLVRRVVMIRPDLLDERNDDGDTPLHLAARAGHVSTLAILFPALLLKFRCHSSSKLALDEILVRNLQGNTFFHEALLNGHKDVMNILASPQEREIEGGFMELVEETVYGWTEGQHKSVLCTVIEKGFKDILDRALNKIIPNREKVLRTLNPRIDMISIVTEEAKDLNLLKLDELQESLKAHEERSRKRKR
ncbi:unnamed protein product [Sphenostylis stenocarpa]|uniref:Uncharacterized protein n=1 Tax=Sphenostylis stenocarpa TaxID=92480 RepID=A0AA86SU11_9FABA|nr:unnamed protein product [Sphenostylis stenocarpa]